MGTKRLGMSSPAVKKLVTRAQEVLQVQDRRETPSKKNGHFLHLAHYTSLEALISMLQDPSGGLRLSDSSTMNDPDEGKTTRDGRIFEKLLKEHPGKDSWLLKRYEAAHICCFVGVTNEGQGSGEDAALEAGDDLLFWRLYGNQGRGVSLTIPPHYAKELVDAAVVQRVTYRDEPPIETDLTSIANLLRDLDDLKRQAIEEDAWDTIRPEVIPAFDRLFGQRFLHKRSHYEMEREYRAVVFVGTDDGACTAAPRLSARGLHVQYGLVRSYVQIPELDCQRILTTNSRITIGRNVPESKDAKRALARLLKALGVSAGVVRMSLSRFKYRPR